MKKTLALILCLIMVAAVAVSAISADETKLIDARELQQWGQIHYYLPAVAANKVPVMDGVIGADEYYYSFDFLLDGSNQQAYLNEGNKANGFSNTEWAKCYMSFDGENFYMAMQTKDNYYVIDKDMFYINLGFADGGTSRHAVERLRFDIEEDATTGETKLGMSQFFKNADGSWEASRGLTYDMFMDATVSYDETTQIFLFEGVFNVPAMMEQWPDNQNAIEDVRMYFNPMLRMQGGSAAGATDGPIEQGYVWHYMGIVPAEVKMNFTLDYPEESYWGGMFPNIVHFCEKPAETTAAPTTTAEPTTAAPTTTAAATTKAATTVAATTVADATAAATTAAATDAAKGCKSTVALSALALVPMLGAAVVFGKKRED